MDRAGLDGDECFAPGDRSTKRKEGRWPQAKLPAFSSA